MNDLLGRVPPYNIEAEKAILGSSMLDTEAKDEIFSLVKPEDFYINTHQDIYNAIQTLDSKDKPPDMLMVEEELKSRGVLDKVGGLSYLTELCMGVSTVANVKYYAMIVREKAILRRFIKVSSDITNMCYEQSEDVTQIIQKAEAGILAAAGSTIKDISHISEAALGALEFIESRCTNQGKPQGLMSGFFDLDYKLCGFQNGDLIIIAGRPSMGKTAFAENIATRVAVRDHIPVAFFSLEMPKEKIVLRQISNLAIVDNQKIRTGTIGDRDKEDIAKVYKKILEAPMYIDDTPNIKTSEIAAKCRRIKKNKGDLRLIVIDHLTELWRPRKGGDVAEHEENIRAVKRIAREMKCPVILLQQLNRQVEYRNNKRPQLSDLRETGAAEEVADTVLLLYRDDYYDPDSAEKGIAEVIIAKGRDTGTGTVEVGWQPQYTRFVNLVK